MNETKKKGKSCIHILKLVQISRIINTSRTTFYKWTREVKREEDTPYTRDLYTMIQNIKFLLQFSTQ